MTAPAMMTEHPDDQTLASFADHRLGPEERAAVIRHLSDCGECFSVVETAWAYNDAEAVTSQKPAEETSVVLPFMPSVPITVTAIAAALAIAVVALPDVRAWITAKRTGGQSTVIDAAADSPERKIQGRLSGGFPHREFIQKRGVSEHSELAMEMAKLKLQESSANGSWRELRSLAHAQLLSATPEEPEERDEAVKTLERALQKAGEEKPELINDLAAFHIERIRFGHKGATEAALKYAERAWALEKTPESAFNRALAYEWAHRDAEAKRAWHDYLKLDSTSAWADEVRTHLQLLEPDPALN